MYHFNEVCHRSPNRWDLKVPESDEWTQLCDQAVRTSSVSLELTDYSQVDMLDVR